jgi:hypothetical protein
MNFTSTAKQADKVADQGSISKPKQGILAQRGESTGSSM